MLSFNETSSFFSLVGQGEGDQEASQNAFVGLFVLKAYAVGFAQL